MLSLNTHGTNNITTHNLVGGNFSDDLGKEAGYCTSIGMWDCVEGTTVDNSQLGNNVATRVISVLYNHSLA